MKIFISLLFVLISSNLFANQSTTYVDFAYDTDSMCFGNGASELAGVVPILGNLGDKQGVCQGIAGVTSAFYTNATFDETLDAPKTEAEAEKIIKLVVKAHKGNCSKKIVVPGHANMNEFCKANKRLFLKHVILYNANIASVEILPLLPEFFAQQKKGMTKKSKLKKINKALNSFRESLRNNRPPLMLYFRHVVMVTEMKDEFENGVLKRVNLEVYDSNFGMSNRFSFEYDSNGLPVSGTQMIWDVTPDRFLVSCK